MVGIALRDGQPLALRPCGHRLLILRRRRETMVPLLLAQILVAQRRVSVLHVVQYLFFFFKVGRLQSKDEAQHLIGAIRSDELGSAVLYGTRRLLDGSSLLCRGVR